MGFTRCPRPRPARRRPSGRPQEDDEGRARSLFPSPSARLPASLRSAPGKPPGTRGPAPCSRPAGSGGRRASLYPRAAVPGTGGPAYGGERLGVACGRVCVRVRDRYVCVCVSAVCVIGMCVRPCVRVRGVCPGMCVRVCMCGCGVRDRCVCRGCVQCVCLCVRVGGVCARAECVSGSVGVRAACVIGVCVCVCVCARARDVSVGGTRVCALAGCACARAACVGVRCARRAGQGRAGGGEECAGAAWRCKSPT